MDCMISRWCQCPASPGDGPSCHHTYGGYSLVVLFERHLVSQLKLMLDAACLSQVQVAAGKQMFLSSQQLPGLSLLILRPILYTLEIYLIQDPVFLGATGRSFWWFCWEGYQWYLIGWSNFPDNDWLGPQGGEQPGSWCRSVPTRTPGATSHMWPLAQWWWAAGDPRLALQAHGPTVCGTIPIFMVPNGRNDDSPCGTVVPLDVAKVDPL